MINAHYYIMDKEIFEKVHIVQYGKGTRGKVKVVEN